MTVELTDNQNVNQILDLMHNLRDLQYTIIGTRSQRIQDYQNKTFVSNMVNLLGEEARGFHVGFANPLGSNKPRVTLRIFVGKDIYDTDYRFSIVDQMSYFIDNIITFPETEDIESSKNIYYGILDTQEDPPRVKYHLYNILKQERDPNPQNP